MIHRSNHFDLGRDKTRMKDPADAERQSRTVDFILSRFFNPKEQKRWDIQILADEVGMGKTFVALGVAYSILQHLVEGRTELELAKCYQKILVVTPTNSALFAKWQREVAEFVKRCVSPELQKRATVWFSPTPVERLDELSAELRKRGRGSGVLVTTMGVFHGGKLRNYELKRRFLLGCLFLHWGNRLLVQERERLLKDAPKNWPENPYALTTLDETEQQHVPFSAEEIRSELLRIERSASTLSHTLEKLAGLCKSLSQPYVPFRDIDFHRKVEPLLDELYKGLTVRLIRKSFPLVIVDEAHNWKNHKNGYEGFVDVVAPRTRRALLLTATPFQLHPEEILRILEVSDSLRPCTTQEESKERLEKMALHRDRVIKPVLKRSASSSERFTSAWRDVPQKITTRTLQEVWKSNAFAHARRELERVAAKQGVASDREIQEIIDQALVGVDPDIRQLMRAALWLYTHNADLSHELGAMVIRHRRRTDHRLFKVGGEFPVSSKEVAHRPDSHTLHVAPGIDVRGEGELPQYLLMRCVSEMKGFKGKSSLGNALTGCYSTLLASHEGKQVSAILKENPLGKMYLDLLLAMVDPSQDPSHPKMRDVVHAVVKAWEKGEKSLVFCFRVNTAKRLRDIIDQEIRSKLKERRVSCLGGEERLKNLKKRLTGREQDLVTLGLDRVLWSFILKETYSSGASSGLTPRDLKLNKEDLAKLARLAILHGVEITGNRADRVFLNRATEHILAGRLLHSRTFSKTWKLLLQEVAEPPWVQGPYGLQPGEEKEDAGEDVASFDERGVHFRYLPGKEPSPEAITSLATELYETRKRAKLRGQRPLLDAYARNPSLWLGTKPMETPNRIRQSKGQASRFQTLGRIHEHLYWLIHTGDGFDWEARRQVFQAMRKALLRESVLLRLLPSRTELEESSWDELLVQAFLDRMPRQNESMADRLAIFLEDLLAASGSLSDKSSARSTLLSATRLSDQTFVALVSGQDHTGKQSRERVFAGFNTPLLPEVLICTSVGQEGIDLHRHCRHVIHYDLAWNPAVLEQRTGRTDRIGSKTFRERALAEQEDLLFLEIGVPYLAGTYDERMYEELRLRAQTFEVLTGGELATTEVEGRDDKEAMEGEENPDLNLILLPESMVTDLRVKLEVPSSS